MQTKTPRHLDAADLREQSADFRLALSFAKAAIEAAQDPNANAFAVLANLRLVGQCANDATDEAAAILGRREAAAL